MKANEMEALEGVNFTSRVAEVAYSFVCWRTDFGSAENSLPGGFASSSTSKPFCDHRKNQRRPHCTVRQLQPAA